MRQHFSRGDASARKTTSTYPISYKIIKLSKLTASGLQPVVAAVDRKVHKPNINTKNWESEAPSSEMVFKRDFEQFDEAWKAGYELLHNSVEQHMTKKQPNLELYIVNNTQ